MTATNDIQPLATNLIGGGGGLAIGTGGATLVGGWEVSLRSSGSTGVKRLEILLGIRLAAATQWEVVAATASRLKPVNALDDWFTS